MADDKYKDKLEKQSDEDRQKCDEYLAGWKRASADLANYKKDEEKRAAELIKFANEGMILELINFFDEVKVALNYAPESLVKDEKWHEGIKSLIKKFEDLLARHGVEKIKTEEEKFNPAKHEAVTEENSDKEPGEIIEEVQAGYTMRGKVIRAAKVKIAK